MDSFSKTQSIPLRVLRSVRLQAQGLLKPKFKQKKIVEKCTWEQRQATQQSRNLDNLIQHLEAELGIDGSSPPSTKRC